jgi:Zn-dependent protease with chaperone function/Tfp pilus assembly major pilin PilA
MAGVRRWAAACIKPTTGAIMNSVYKTEKSLFAISFVLSAIFWVALIAGTFGIALVYLLLLFIFYLFVHSAFISYIRGTGVKVTKNQFPELYYSYEVCCKALDIKQEPELFIIAADGMLNALATRFLRRKYVVLFSNIVDALESNPNAVKFYMGHELGHISRNHLGWSFFLFPAGILPLLGAAYSRACEYTCDLHGYQCCEAAPDDALRAIAVLAAGERRWQSINIEKYIEQIAWTSGFWMSLHELTGDYPWLSKRMAHIYSIGKKTTINIPGRHFFAWVLALFIPRLGIRGGGAASLIIVIAIIGILAAIALPAYQDFTIRARSAEAVALADSIGNAIVDYAMEHDVLPESLAEVGYGDDLTNQNITSVEYDNSSGSLTIYVKTGASSESIVFTPQQTETNEIYWDCSGGTMETKLRPVRCRE